MGQAVLLNPAWVPGVQGSWYPMVLGWAWWLFLPAPAHSEHAVSRTHWERAEHFSIWRISFTCPCCAYLQIAALTNKISVQDVMVFYNIVKSKFNFDLFAAVAELLNHHLCFFSWRNLFSCRFCFLAWILRANVRVVLYIKMHHYSSWYRSMIIMK